MPRTVRRRSAKPVVLLVLLLVALSPAARAQSDVLVAAERLLYEGQAGAAADTLADGLAADPADASVRLALGTVQAMTALEALAQDAFRHGLGGGGIEEAGQMLGVPVTAESPTRAGRVRRRACGVWSGSTRAWWRPTRPSLP
ncbi:MAG: hypothetical protein U5J97_10315 [Trueperaceae bacterium]|nr:hypothetical protein [Trueperaceae bacterium]